MRTSLGVHELAADLAVGEQVGDPALLVLRGPEARVGAVRRGHGGLHPVGPLAPRLAARAPARRTSPGRRRRARPRSAAARARRGDGKSLPSGVSRSRAAPPFEHQQAEVAVVGQHPAQLPQQRRALAASCTAPRGTRRPGSPVATGSASPAPTATGRPKSARAVRQAPGIGSTTSGRAPKRLGGVGRGAAGAAADVEQPGARVEPARGAPASRARPGWRSPGTPPGGRGRRPAPGPPAASTPRRDRTRPPSRRSCRAPLISAPIAALISAPARSPRPVAEAGQVDPDDPVHREHGPGLPHRLRAPGRHRVRCGEHVAPRARRPGRGRGSGAAPRPIARRCRPRRPPRTAAAPRSRAPRPRTRPAVRRCPTWLSTTTCAPASCFASRRPARRCRGGASGASGTPTGEPVVRGHAREPGAVDVEDLGHLVAHAGRAAVTGGAEHPDPAQRGQALQLLLQHDAVAVAAGQRDPRPHTPFLDQRRHQGGRQVGPVLVLADEHGVAGRGEHVDDLARRPTGRRRAA